MKVCAEAGRSHGNSATSPLAVPAFLFEFKLKFLYTTDHNGSVVSNPITSSSNYIITIENVEVELESGWKMFGKWRMIRLGIGFFNHSQEAKFLWSVIPSRQVLDTLSPNCVSVWKGPSEVDFKVRQVM